MGRSGELVAVRFLDGRVIKGETADFRPARGHFDMTVAGNPDPVRINVKDLKALFFIKSFEGNSKHEEYKSFDHPTGVWNKIWIEFACDGEQLAGWSSPSLMGRNGFFLIPTDQHSNIARTFVFRAALTRLLKGADAEQAAREYARERMSDAEALARKSAAEPSHDGAGATADAASPSRESPRRSAGHAEPHERRRKTVVPDWNPWDESFAMNADKIRELLGD